jgi:hypothetical protein
MRVTSYTGVICHARNNNQPNDLPRRVGQEYPFLIAPKISPKYSENLNFEELNTHLHLNVISLQSILVQCTPNWSLPFRLIPNVVCLSYPYHASWRWDSITITFRGRSQLRRCVLCNSSNLPLQHTRLHLASNIVLSNLVSNVHNLCSSRIVTNLFSYLCHFFKITDTEQLILKVTVS